MRIKSVKIQGFKSFREETILMFPKNITAIVGPNGAGKSNLADAFRWVLGEQSLKNIRSKDGADVIFSGSKKELRLSRAQVTISFDVDSPQNNLSEIEITRKIYTDGTGLYLFNNSEVRLLDIQLFLAEHYVGQKNYAVIGQGMIDEVLKQSPEERVDFFYEATGVKKHQIKLRKAQLKLKTSEERLAQTQTLLAEITPHKKYLAKQAEKYLKRKELIDELRKKQVIYYRLALARINQAIMEKKQDFAQIENETVKSTKDAEATEKEMQILKNSDSQETEYQILTAELRSAERERQNLCDKIRSLEREKEYKWEEQGDFDAAFFNRRLKDIENILNEIQIKEEELNTSFSRVQETLKTKKEELKIVESRVLDTHRKTQLSKEELISRLKNLLLKTSLETIKKEVEDLIEELKAPEILERQNILDISQELNAETDELKLQKEIILEKKKLLAENKTQYKHEANDLSLKLKKYEPSAKTFFVEIVKQLEENKSLLETVEVRIKKIEQKISQFNRSAETKRVKMYSLQEKYQAIKTQQEHLQGLWQAVKIELAKLEVEEQQLKEEIKENLNEETTLLILKNQSDSHIANDGNQNINLRNLHQEIKSLQNIVSQIGEVEDSILKEYEEVKTRFDFLTEQTADLETAIASFKKISAELQEKITNQFDEQFQRLKKEFQKYFQVLFDGGKAVIERCFNGNGEMGIEITAQPPGKLIKHTNVLSGGEKSLTAIALLCAIISSNPPPFIILDEMDAALDEANSNRLAEILKTLSKNTELILITHNRTTMEMAEVLYGVTIDKEGISRIVSVKLEDYL